MSGNGKLAEKFCEELKKVLGFMRGCSCRLYGSYKGDYAIESSNVNIELHSNSNNNGISTRFLQEVVKIFLREKPDYYVQYIPAPKLNDSFITITENENGLDCEMKYLGPADKYYKTTCLIERLIKMDACVKTLIIALRHWSEICRIHETENGYLHPLCYVLMVIHFLQQHDPPILPIASVCKDEDGSIRCNVPNMPRLIDMSPVGELWLQLLQYYDSFNWRDDVISITSHHLLGKDEFSSSCWIGIAAPMDSSQNIAKSVTDPDASHLIQKCFSRAFNYFSKPTNNIKHSSENGGDSAAWDEGFSEPEYDYSFDEINFTESVDMFSLCLKCKEFLCICDNSDDDDDESISSIPSSQEISEDLIKNIDTALKELYHEHILSEDEIRERKRIVFDIERYIRLRFHDAKLEIMGSTKNGFGFKKSDLDICLTFDMKKMLSDVNPIVTLKILRAHLRKNSKFSNVLAIFGAKIPLIQFVWRESGLRGDISLYNLLAVRNTELLYTYSCIDIRCRILGSAMKLLAKHAGLANAAEKSLSSYSYILLVIYFLQKTDPPVLPVLQELSTVKKPKEERKIENWDTHFFDDIKNLDHVWPSFNKNKQSVGELWVNLLEFYTKNFDFNTVITIQTSKHKTIDDLPIRIARLFNILDPFIRTKNLGSLMSEIMAERTNRTFHRAYKLLYNNQVPKGFKGFKEYLFDPMNLTEGRLSKLTECEICGKLGHSADRCPRNNFVKRGFGRFSYNTRANNYRTKMPFNNSSNRNFADR